VCGEDATGCLISSESGPTGAHFGRMCSSMEEGIRCVNETHDAMTMHVCECEGSLCNMDFYTAGEHGTTPGPTPGGTTKCYQCSSVDGGQCDGHTPGDQVECPDTDGCLISYETSTSGNTYVRDCADSQGGGQVEERCDREDYEGGMSLRYCVCADPLCNIDWQVN